MNVRVQRLRSLPQWLQFTLVGCVAAATHLLVVLWLVYFADAQPLAANVLGFLVAFVVSYNGHALFTFSKARVTGWAVAARFFLVACGSFVVNELLYAAALRWLGWNYLISLFVVLLLVAVGTFLVSKFWAFKARGDA